MRLSYVLLLAAAALVATIDASSALSSSTLTKPDAGITNAHEIIKNESRFLRTHKKVDVVEEDEDDDEEGEARGLFDKIKAAAIASEFLGKSDDDMMTMAKDLSKQELNLLFNQGSDQLAKVIPGFSKDMDSIAFQNALQVSTGLTAAQKGALEIAFLQRLAKNLAKELD